MVPGGYSNIGQEVDNRKRIIHNKCRRFDVKKHPEMYFLQNREFFLPPARSRELGLLHLVALIGIVCGKPSSKARLCGTRCSTPETKFLISIAVALN